MSTTSSAAHMFTVPSPFCYTYNRIHLITNMQSSTYFYLLLSTIISGASAYTCPKGYITSMPNPDIGLTSNMLNVPMPREAVCCTTSGAFILGSTNNCRRIGE